MKTKKIISLYLVLALSFCVSANVFAADLTASATSADHTSTDTTLDTSALQQTIQVGSSLFLPKIEVKISTPNRVIVNPYKMEYSTGKKDSLISAPSTIESKSTIKMNISALPKAALVSDSNVEFLGSPLAGKTLDGPKVYAKLVMANFASASDISSTTWTPVSGSEKNVVITTTNDQAVEIALNASDGTNATVGGYKFDGESGGPNWTEKDLIQVNIIFSINPVIA